MRVLTFLLMAAIPATAGIAAPAQKTSEWPKETIPFCEASLRQLPGKIKDDAVKGVCARAALLDTCTSERGFPIYHFDADGKRADGKRILVFSLVHGDEFESGSVSRRWMERLLGLESRNAWRIVPILNPDGWMDKKRTNANAVDINRNFPSKNWEETAVKYWDEKIKRDPRKNPGVKAGSEKETRCAMAHIEAYKPDFIIAVHTPYGVLDFDGPSIEKPRFQYLPWGNLGTFPGSLGRYMWSDQNVPVLTIELKPNNMAFLENLDHMDFLQDVSGKVALKAVETVHGKSK